MCTSIIRWAPTFFVCPIYSSILSNASYDAGEEVFRILSSSDFRQLNISRAIVVNVTMAEQCRWINANTEDDFGNSQRLKSSV